MTALNLPFDIRFIWGGAKLAFPFIRRGITPEGEILQISERNLRKFIVHLFQQPRPIFYPVFWATRKQTPCF